MTDRLNENLWNDFLERLEYLNNGVIRTKIKWEILDDSDRYYSDATGTLSPISTTFLSHAVNQIELLSTEVNKLNSIFELVNAGQVGVLDSYEVPGDFDFVVTQGSFSDQEIVDLKVDLDALYRAEKLGVAPLVIAAGLVVTALVVGGVITVTALITKQEEIEAEIEAKQIELEHKIIANPDMIEDWTEYKQANQGKARGIIDEFLGTGATQKLFAGAAGVVFMVVAGYYILKYMEKKKQ